MAALPLVWTLLTVSLTSGWSQILQQETVKILYPKILSTEDIECDCVNKCDNVYWFRSIHNHEKLEFLGKCNNAGRGVHGTAVDKARFKLSRRSSASFVLSIVNVTEEDTGIYSCVLKERNNETWKSGILLRPGVTPPTSPPQTKSKPEPVCRCPAKDSSQDDCSSLVLWPLVGLVAALALALIGSLYYFSRLPKKCRHHFVKKR
ncbi:uncharacterized protein ACO6RY_08710 [Pungitius sinensis]